MYEIPEESKKVKIKNIKKTLVFIFIFIYHPVDVGLLYPNNNKFYIMRRVLSTSIHGRYCKISCGIQEADENVAAKEAGRTAKKKCYLPI
jgi:hypothetical protein